MIEGTRPYRGKKADATVIVGDVASPQSSPANEATDATAASGAPTREGAPRSDAANLDRRAWFSSLVPALGSGLVQILRTSNHLRDELRELQQSDRAGDERGR